MNLETLIFYGFAAVLIFAALSVVTARHSVRAVLSLVLCFFAASGIWMLFEAEFLAVTLILVYVGAVMVLFLFVVMMLDVDYAALKQGFIRWLPLAVLVAAGFLAALHWGVGELHFPVDQYPPPEHRTEDYSNVKELGRILYTEFFYPFEVAAVILLVAMIAAISLTFRGKRNRKSQDVDKQVHATKDERLKIVSVEPVRKNKEEQAS